MKKWFISSKKDDFYGIAERFNITPMLARILRNRDVCGDEAIDMYLNGTVSDMHDPHKLKDIDKAADIILDKIRSDETIFIIGDYDIDGVCSSYILARGIGALGGKTVVRLPDRVKDGYGMNISMVDEAIESGASLILTCDNGISAYEEVSYAVKKGLSVVVTDHHEVPFEEDGDGKKYLLPPADAVVDPKREDCSYPFCEICGAMVVYKLIQCLFESTGGDSELLDEFLMFAGFATVGDVMELKDENRIAVKYALDKMKTTGNNGMKCLIDVTGLDRGRLSAHHIGFVLGPCINATGRLDLADRALALFMQDKYEDALMIATELKSLNDSRKDMTERFKDTAFGMIDGNASFEKDRVLVIYLPDCHESLAGIIAGRIKERYNKPAFVLTKAEDCIKGSGRSIEAYDMYEEMNKCRELFIRYGGHKMAAGLSIDEDKVDEFRKKINENCSLTEDDMIPKLTADMELPLSYADFKLARELDRLKPYGTGNKRALFAGRDIKISSIKVLGQKKNVVKLKLIQDNGKRTVRDAIIYGEGESITADLEGRESIKVMYELDINEYMGKESIQLIVKDWM